MPLITRTLVLYIPKKSCSYVPGRHGFTRNFFLVIFKSVFDGRKVVV